MTDPDYKIAVETRRQALCVIRWRYITLRAPRADGDRNAALEQPVMEAFLKFAESVGAMVRVGRQRPRRVAGGAYFPAGRAVPWDHFLMLITMSK
jgi:hypothetical protein